VRSREPRGAWNIVFISALPGEDGRWLLPAADQEVDCERVRRRSQCANEHTTCKHVSAFATAHLIRARLTDARSISRTLDVVSRCKNLRTLAPLPRREYSFMKSPRTCSIGAPARSVNDLIVRSCRAGSSSSVSAFGLMGISCWVRSGIEATPLFAAHAEASRGDRPCGGAHMAGAHTQSLSWPEQSSTRRHTVRLRASLSSLPRPTAPPRGAPSEVLCVCVVAYRRRASRPIASSP
jgi:hypothetical protein